MQALWKSVVCTWICKCLAVWVPSLDRAVVHLHVSSTSTCGVVFVLNLMRIVTCVQLSRKYKKGPVCMIIVLLALLFSTAASSSPRAPNIFKVAFETTVATEGGVFVIEVRGICCDLFGYLRKISSLIVLGALLEWIVSMSWSRMASLMTLDFLGLFKDLWSNLASTQTPNKTIDGIVFSMTKPRGSIQIPKAQYLLQWRGQGRGQHSYLLIWLTIVSWTAWGLHHWGV